MRKYKFSSFTHKQMALFHVILALNVPFSTSFERKLPLHVGLKFQELFFIPQHETSSLMRSSSFISSIVVSSSCSLSSTRRDATYWPEFTQLHLHNINNSTDASCVCTRPIHFVDNDAWRLICSSIAVNFDLFIFHPRWLPRMFPSFFFVIYFRGRK